MCCLQEVRGLADPSVAGGRGRGCCRCGSVGKVGAKGRVGEVEGGSVDVTARWKRAGSGSMVSMVMRIRVNQGKLAKPKYENTCGEFCQRREFYGKRERVR